MAALCFLPDFYAALCNQFPVGKKNKHKIEPCLDLHGVVVEDVDDQVDRFIRTTKAGRVRIMPGKGSGKVKNAVIQYLKLGGFPWEYERLPNGQPNEGVLVVFLD
jgi:hypothetical protein